MTICFFSTVREILLESGAETVSKTLNSLVSAPHDGGYQALCKAGAGRPKGAGMNKSERRVDFRPDCEGVTATLSAKGPVPTANNYDRERSVHDLVSEQSAVRPDAIALQFGGVRLTYAELDRMSSALAGELLRQGTEKGDVVGLLLPRALTTVVAKLAILKAGAVYAPFDPAYPAEHLGYMADDCRPKLILADRENLSVVQEISPAGIATDIADLLDRAKEASIPSLPHVTGSDPAYVMYTSGSTGRPKGVVIPHRGIVRLVREQNYIRFLPEDTVLHTATISFDAATFEIWGALLNGCRLVGIGDRTLSLQRIADEIERERVTVMLLTTGLFHLLVDHRPSGFPSLRHVLFGGEVASASHAKRFMHANPGCLLTNAYGPTEATVLGSVYTIPPDFEGDEIPIGRSIAHSRVHVLDDELNEVPAETEGQLAISGDGLAIGYLNRPDLTRERFVAIQGPDGETIRCYLTGDVVVMYSDGLLHFRGRRDRQIKIDGKRIELDEIEAALRRDASLADAVVICHQEGGSKRIIAYLKPRPPLLIEKEDLAGTVLSNLRAVLPRHMIPSSGIVLEQFPMNQAGKIDRSKLPVPSFEASPATPAPPSEEGTEALLKKLWESVLGRSGIGIDQNFFDLGGTSLQLIRVHAAIEEAFGRHVDVVTVFQHPTIRALASHLDAGQANGSLMAAARTRADLQRKGLTQFRRRLP